MVQIGRRVTQGLRKVLRFAAVSCHDVAVLYRRYCTGNGSWTSWNRQRDPVRPAEQHQFEVRTIPHSIYTFFPFFCVFSDVITVYMFLFLFLSLEVGNCIAVQVCMLQIPLLILFNAVYVSNRKKDRLYADDFLWLISAQHGRLRFFGRTSALFSYSATCTCGRASSASSWSITSSWMESATISRVSAVCYRIAGLAGVTWTKYRLKEQL